MNFDPQKNVTRCYLDGTHRSGNSESRRVGLMSSPANRDWGSYFAGQCKARLGSAWQGLARQGTRGGWAWHGLERNGPAGLGMDLGWPRHGSVGCGRAWQGLVRHGTRQGLAWRGMARLAVARFGQAWRCMARGATRKTHTSSTRYNT